MFWSFCCYLQQGPTMFTTTFEAQLTQFLTERPAPCNRDIIIEGTQSLMVTRWKDLWIKVPQKEEFQWAYEGYTKAHALGYCDNLHIEKAEIITLHIEGTFVNKSHIPLIKELWGKMVKDSFFLHDWHCKNIIVDIKHNLHVIDWGVCTEEEYYAEPEFLEFLEYGLE